MKLILLILLVLSFDLSAENKTVSWVAVTEDTENDPITIDHYNLYCALSGEEAKPINVGNVIEHSVNLKPGTNNCTVTAVASINGALVESEHSNVAEKIIIVRPKPTIIKFSLSGSITIN